MSRGAAISEGVGLGTLRAALAAGGCVACGQRRLRGPASPGFCRFFCFPRLCSFFLFGLQAHVGSACGLAFRRDRDTGLCSRRALR